MKDFKEEILNELEAEEFGPETRRRYLRTVHSFAAHASGIWEGYHGSFGDVLIVEGGNLDYYAGFEYVDHDLVEEFGGLKIYAAEDERIEEAIDLLREIKGEVRDGVEVVTRNSGLSEDE